MCFDTNGECRHSNQYTRCHGPGRETGWPSSKCESLQGVGTRNNTRLIVCSLETEIEMEESSIKSKYLLFLLETHCGIGTLVGQLSTTGLALSLRSSSQSQGSTNNLEECTSKPTPPSSHSHNTMQCLERPSRRSRVSARPGGLPTPWRAHSIVALFLLGCVASCGALSDSGVVYPPLVNAALQAAVTVSPASNVCGLRRDVKYCKSTVDANTLTSCWEETCTSKCPYAPDLYHELVFTRVEQHSWGHCVSRQFDDLAPAASTAHVQSYRVRFLGTGGNGTCHLDIPPSWMAVLFLQAVRSVTLAMWVRPVNTSSDSTIFIIGTTDSRAVVRLGMTARLQLFITSHTQPWTTRPDWKIPANRWTHLVLRIRGDTVSIALNGQYVSPAAYGVTFLAIKQSAKYRIGQSLQQNDYFKGDIQDFRIYVKSLSNREVGEIYSGILPSTRIQSNCRCPDDHPSLKPTDHTYCIANDGNAMPLSEMYRLDRHSYPLEFLNDGKTDTAWVGKVGVGLTTITVELAKQYEVVNVELMFYSSLPDTLTIERRANITKAWTTWQYYAHDCPAKFSLPNNGPISTEHAVNCRLMVTTPGNPPASAGEVLFNVLEGRPGRNGTSLTYSLRQFLQADAVRIVLNGHPFSMLQNKMYHGLYEVTINARCDCHGHGIACDTSGYEYMCTCAPESYTTGRTCEQCVDGTYRDTTKSDYSAHVCKPCDCDAVGSVNGVSTCENTGGQCQCKKSVGRRRCDTCLPGYHGLDATQPDGCRRCICDQQGTQGGSNICSVTSGQCPCKQNVDGLQCDGCKTGFYSLKQSQPDGCLACGCDPAGVLQGDLSCNQVTGQCHCRAGVTGNKCESCSMGFYKTNTTQGDACQECACDAIGANGTSCDSTTGQCSCNPNVIGRSCNVCKLGYYAPSDASMRSEGCSMRCACSQAGTAAGSGEQCETVGGQCPCKRHTAGRQCDVCKSMMYGFGTSPTHGCQDCNCDIRGSIGGSQQCNVTTGQCPCKDNVEKRRCDVCKDEMYGLMASLPAGCEPCGCYEAGTQPGVACDRHTGRCFCIQEAGKPAATNFKCEPYITQIVPTFGPESGGTNIRLIGGFLSDIENTLIKVGSLECHISSSAPGNHTSIECVTRTLRDTQDPAEMKGVPMAVTLTMSSSLTVSCPDKFTYLPDPTIKDISPQKTFLQGGLNLTVTGQHLNSVYRPLMQVTMQGPTTKKVFQSVCTVIAPAIMNCPTPIITDPDKLMDSPAARRRRSIDTDTHTNDVITTNSGRGRLVHNTHSRGRRAARDDDQAINRPSLKFYLGFILDGLTIYQDLQNSDIPEFAVLSVYFNPLLQKFGYQKGIYIYRPYWPFNHASVNIKGSHLALAATAEDYIVEIGMEMCEDIDLTNNLLTCRPPEKQPVRNSKHGEGPSIPAVVVTVGNIRVNIGWMDYEHTFWENLTFRYAVIGSVAGLILLILIICLLCCCCCKRCRQQPAEKPHPHLELNGKGSSNNAYISAYNNSQSSYMSPSMELLSLLPERLQQRLQSSLIDFKRMEIGKLIGQGHFGLIYLGRLTNEDHTAQIPIAIKTLREYHVAPRDVAYFLDEATIMKDLKHEHVLHLLGVVIENNRSYVLLPFMEKGDLKTFISTEDNLLTVGELIHFGQQVADGMCYLSGQKFVHRDLAARNCMVDRNLVVKIADFGLSRELYESDYYVEGEASRPLPVKWMSYESLDRGVFTALSDVWSFGVLLWELMTRGCTPYPDVDCFDMKVYITCGNRMDKPDFAPHELYELMLLCWHREPQSRPAFFEIHTRLGEILDGQNASNTMRNHHERQVRPLSFGGAHTNYAFTTEIARDVDY